MCGNLAFALPVDSDPRPRELQTPGAAQAKFVVCDQAIDAQYSGRWELPVLGAVAASTAVLIRPDGHVAWVGDRTGPGLADTLTTWFGPPTAA